jgi:hypothetical protein
MPLDTPTPSILSYQKGDVEVARVDLGNYPGPRSTNTYRTVHHDELVDLIERKAKIYGLTKKDDKYVVGRGGKIMVGHIRFLTPSIQRSDLPYSLCIRNSYDKSCSIILAGGPYVSVCSNLSLWGSDCTYSRIHTKNVIGDLEVQLDKLIPGTLIGYGGAVARLDRMKRIPLTDMMATMLFGTALCERVLPYRLFLQARKLWAEPEFEEFAPRNLWSWYNACTSSFHNLPVSSVFDRHTGLTAFLDNLEVDVRQERIGFAHHYCQERQGAAVTLAPTTP